MTQPFDAPHLAIAEEALEPAAFERALAEALADEEENLRQIEHIRWFLRRYPTAEARLRYTRRLYAQWVGKRGR